jgi:hypothetical protein
MRRQHLRIFLVATIAVLALLSPPNTGVGRAASAGEINGRMIFTASDINYSITDSNGTFTGQVTWGGAGHPMAWSFRVSPQVRAIATTPMTCEAGHVQLPYSDKHVVPVDYMWHSTVRGHATNTDYVLYGSCEFDVNVGGRTGTAILRFNFDYQMKSP